MSFLLFADCSKLRRWWNITTRLFYVWLERSVIVSQSLFSASMQIKGVFPLPIIFLPLPLPTLGSLSLYLSFGLKHLDQGSLCLQLVAHLLCTRAKLHAFSQF